MNGTGRHHRPLRAALVLAGVGALLLLLGLLIGSGRFEWPWSGDAPPILADIVWSIRAPRSAGAWAAGALLGLAGAIAQGIFRNPLADPYLLGSSSGAALAVALSLSVLSAWAHTPDAQAYIAPFLAFGLTGVAFVGALLAVFLTVGLAGGATQGPRLLLGGVVVGVVLGALTSFVAFLNPAVLLNMQGFMLGSTALLSWGGVSRMLCVGVVCLLCAVSLAKPLDALSLGTTTARSLGIPLARVNAMLIVLLAIATGAAVAHTGLIAFVGLAAPHAVRAWLPCKHGALLVLSSLMGGALLLSADVMSRALFAPTELPVGLLTAVIGGSYLLWRMRRVPA